MSRGALVAISLVSGAAGLTWEVLWQHHASLSLGVSAYGTAITLASVMAGLGAGAAMADAAVRRTRWPPLRAYALVELVLGTGGLLVAPVLLLAAELDTALFAIGPGVADAARAPVTALVLFVPSAAMGATVPLLAPAAAEARVSLALVYAANTFGAVAGVLVATFVLLPLVGVTYTAIAAAATNAGVGLWAARSSRRGRLATPPVAIAPPHRATAIAFLTGAVVFALEVGFFRSLRAAFQSTTETFAILLAAFLVSLALGGVIATRVRKIDAIVPVLLACGGAAALCATPFVVGADAFADYDVGSPIAPIRRFAIVLALVVVPVSLVGAVFPILLAEHPTTAGSGRLYLANTIGAVTGALVTGFVVLPVAGATVACFGASAALLVAAVAIERRRRFLVAAALAAVLGAGVAWRYGGPGAAERVQGFMARDYGEVLFVDEGPDSTVWVAEERASGARKLVIDGFEASGEHPDAEHYMRWMGHLPALAATDVETALVICFGTGQTANAVRLHEPSRLDLVDVNDSVFRAAPLFASNEGVLRDPRVHAHAMDGRAFLRRTDRAYDVVTLEPMPPHFAGTNHLYSREFYARVRSRLSPRGAAAQWLPLHLIGREYVAPIVATFADAFPHTRLWIDPIGGTGILVGRLEPWQPRRSSVPLDLDDREIRRAFVLDEAAIARLARSGPRVTDDNQLLSYGLGRFDRSTRGKGWARALYEENLAELMSFRSSRR